MHRPLFRTFASRVAARVAAGGRPGIARSTVATGARYINVSAGGSVWGDNDGDSGSANQPWAAPPLCDAKFQWMKELLAAPSPVGFEAAMTEGVLRPYFEEFMPESWVRRAALEDFPTLFRPRCSLSSSSSSTAEKNIYCSVLNISRKLDEETTRHACSHV